MHRPDPRYLVLWLFLFGIIIVLFLQVISGYNINRLIGGNKSLRNELQVETALRSIEVDLFLVESNVRGAIITSNKTLLEETQKNNLKIEQQLRKLFQRLQTKIPGKELGLLKNLFQQKIDFNNEIISRF